MKYSYWYAASVFGRKTADPVHCVKRDLGLTLLNHSCYDDADYPINRDETWLFENPQERYKLCVTLNPECDYFPCYVGCEKILAELFFNFSNVDEPRRGDLERQVDDIVRSCGLDFANTDG